MLFESLPKSPSAAPDETCPAPGGNARFPAPPFVSAAHATPWTAAPAEYCKPIRKIEDPSGCVHIILYFHWKSWSEPILDRRAVCTFSVETRSFCRFLLLLLDLSWAKLQIICFLIRKACS